MYDFLRPGEELATALKQRFDKLYSYGVAHGLFRKWRSAYNAYYGNYFLGGDARIGEAGEQGELATIATNHLRNIIKHILVGATQERVVFDCLASNSDIESRNASIIGNAVLDYYFYSEGFGRTVRDALEMSLMFGTAFVKVCWEAQQTLIGMDGEGQPVYKGKPRFIALSPFDVLCEPTKTDWSTHNWVATREIVNKWDLAVIYGNNDPAQIEHIKSLPRIDSLQHFLPNWEQDNDNVWLFKAYHKPTPALPNGRYTVFAIDGTVFEDVMMNPYGDLPVIPLVPDKKFGGVYGHSVSFDMLPLQEALNLLDSSILTNQKAFAIQNVAVARNANVTAAEIPGQLNMIEYDVVPEAPGGGKPEALQLCATPAEVFRYRDGKISEMEQVSGVNAAARGQPSANLTSGTAIALTVTASTTFNASISETYVYAIEAAAMKLLRILQQFQVEEELIAIAGKSSQFATTSFKGDQLTPVHRVRINQGNPLSKTLAGKLEIANNLLNQGGFSSPQEYLEVLHTGSLSPVLENKTAEEAFIRYENDQLAKGKPVQMLATDNHAKHIVGHRLETFRPEIRQSSALLGGFIAHLQEHIDQLEQMAQGNPLLLAVAQEQPLQIDTASMGAQSTPPPSNQGGTVNPQNATKGENPLAPPTTDTVAAGGEQAVAEKGNNMASNLLGRAKAAQQTK